MIVKNNLKGPIFVDVPSHRLLMPGINDIPNAEYAELKPHLTAHIENGDLTEVSGEVPVKTEEDGAQTGDVSKIKEFVKLAPETQKGLVKDCVSVESLEGWLETVTDPSVRLVIEKRIDEIKNYEGEK